MPALRPVPHTGATTRAATLLAAALLVTLSGCSRQPHFVPASADSSLAAPRDSLVEQVRVLQERWGAEGAGEDAARLSAGVLLQDLRARLAAEPQASWEGRARALLDSLDVGAELAGARCALAVNFFSRGDPAAGSWPWLFWCGGGTVRAQAVEGQGMALIAAASRGLDEESVEDSGPPGIAALFARRSGGGQQPLVLAWRLAEDRLDLAQTLGPDSLGGVGSGAFESVGDSVVMLAVRTWRSTPRFDECSTCPHVIHQRRFRWGVEGFQCVQDQVVPSPYGAFVRLIQALTVGDRDGALQLVTRPALVESARRAGWDTVKGPWRAAPGSEERRDEMVFYRGSTEAWKVRFERRGEDWRVDSFEVTSRVIE
jgi:hypothetical protein